MTFSAADNLRTHRLALAREVVEAARVFCDACDRSHLDEKERYVIDVLERRLDALAEAE